MKTLYLDIDGVLLPKYSEGIPEFAEEFIRYAVENFECFWLTSFCRFNDNSDAIAVLSECYKFEVIQLLKKVKPNAWRSIKTEGIDFKKDFYWFEDTPIKVEKVVLEANNMLDRLIIVDLERKDELRNCIERLKQFNSL